MEIRGGGGNGLHLELKALEITVVDCKVISLLNKNNCYVIFVDVHSVSVISTPYTHVGGTLSCYFHELFSPRIISQCSSHHNTHTCMGNNTIVLTCAWRKY